MDETTTAVADAEATVTPEEATTAPVEEAPGAAPEVLRVPEARLVDLLVALGVDTAPDWAGKPRLAEKVNQGISRYKEEGRDIGDSELAALYETIEAVQARGGTVEPTADAAPAAKAKPAKPAAKAKPAKPAKPAAKAKSAPAAKAKPAKPGKPAASGKGKAAGTAAMSYAELKAYRRKHPLEMTERGAGVARTVVHELLNAGKYAKPRPVTKDALLEVLARKFPDRAKEKMATNLSNLVPGRLEREYGLHVWRQRTESGHTGYFIKDEPQPDREPRKPAKVKAKAK